MYKKFNLIFLLFLFLFIFSASGWVDSIDGMQAVTLARNIAYYGKITMPEPEINTGMFLIKGVDGNMYSPIGLGWVLLHLPIAYIAKFVYLKSNITPSIYFPLANDYLITFLSSFINPLFGFGLLLILKKLYYYFNKNHTIAWLCSLIIVFTTNLFTLSKHSFAHVPSIFFISLSLLIIHQYIEQKKTYKLLLSGFFLAFGFIVYNMSVLIVPVTFILTYLLRLFITTKNIGITIRKIQALFKEIFFFLLGTIPILILFFVYNYIRFNNIFDTGYSGSAGDFIYNGILIEGIYGLWLSSGKSVILYSPIILVSFIYAIKMWKKQFFSFFFIVLSIILTLFYGSLIFWNGELSYGPRYLSVLIPIGGIVIAQNWKQINKFLLVAICVIGLYIQVVGITIPYQAQYPPYDTNVVNMPKNFTRKDLFDYWAIGEFIPRYSPPYRLKRSLIKKLLLTPGIIYEQNDIELVKNVSIPINPIIPFIKNQRQLYKHALSNFTMQATQTINLHSISFNLTSLEKKPISYKLCKINECLSGKLSISDSTYSIFLDKSIKLKNKERISLHLLSEDNNPNDFNLDIIGYSINDKVQNLNTFRQQVDDSLYSVEPQREDRKQIINSLWISHDYFHQVINASPDFWWVKTFIFINLPDGYRLFSILLLISFPILAIAVLLNKVIKLK